MASGRNFCCSSNDLLKKFISARKTSAKWLKKVSKAQLKVCASAQVSVDSFLSNIIPENVFKLFLYRNGAPLEKVNNRNNKTPKSKVLTGLKLQLQLQPQPNLDLHLIECLETSYRHYGSRPDLSPELSSTGTRLWNLETCREAFLSNCLPGIFELSELTDKPGIYHNVTVNQSITLILNRTNLIDTWHLRCVWCGTEPNPRKLFGQKSALTFNECTVGTRKTARKGHTLLTQPLKQFSGHLHHWCVKTASLRRSGNVHPNPGPRNDTQPRSPVSSSSPATASASTSKPTLLVNTLNIRGLNDERKLRHLINHCYSQIKRDIDYVFCLQETYITKPYKIPFLWRGNYHLTPGEGNSCGCLTLLSNHMNIIAERTVGNRAHILVCQKSGETTSSYIIANIYAPNPNNSEKVEFFENVFDILSELELNYNCRNIIVVGDFNLNFALKEVMNRNYSAQEANTAKAVLGMISQANLTDIWSEKNEYTWRRANSNIFSTIDRVLFSRQLLRPTSVRTNWSLSFSDHAAVEVGFEALNQVRPERSNITRLDPSILNDQETKSRINEAFEEMLRGARSHWDPHMRLEYAKMCLRTVVEREQADRKVREKSEEELLNVELDIAIKALGNRNDGEAEDVLLEYIEELRVRKSLLVDEKGQRLAEKLGTKWYNEGEKSTRYFLRLLNRTSPDTIKIIEGNDGQEKSTPEEIEKEIIDFYKSLYENYENVSVTEQSEEDDFFQHLSAIEENEADQVTAPLDLDELAKTLAACKDSTPGPDGIPYSFIKNYWLIFGPLIRDAWRHSLVTGKLCPSHKLSFLKLIPKAGKDLKKLTNWRPITLSNCDHKLITKAYSNRLCEKLACKITNAQTAYLKGRLINDNVRALLATIQASNDEPDIDGLIVSLDAKKAFDSVEHTYIGKCLTKLGLESFVPIFKVSRPTRIPANFSHRTLIYTQPGIL